MQYARRQAGRYIQAAKNGEVYSAKKRTVNAEAAGEDTEKNKMGSKTWMIMRDSCDAHLIALNRKVHANSIVISKHGGSSEDVGYRNLKV
jgi:hypothetical protein